MEEINEIIEQMKCAINKYDLPEEYKNVGVGEWQYGVSMIPCHVVLPIVQKQSKMIEKMASNIKELGTLDYDIEEIISNFSVLYDKEINRREC